MALRLLKSSAATSLRARLSTRLQVATVTTTPLGLASDAAEASDEDLFGFDLPTNENSPQLLKTRHTAAHIMAMAVQNLHKDAQITIGPWIDNGYVLTSPTTLRNPPTNKQPSLTSTPLLLSLCLLSILSPFFSASIMTSSSPSNPCRRTI